MDKQQEQRDELMRSAELLERLLGYCPLEVRITTSLLAGGLGGADGQLWRVIAGMLGESIRQGIVKEADVQEAIHGGRQWLRQFAEQEQQEFDSHRMKGQTRH